MKIIFCDLNKQYLNMKKEIDANINKVLTHCNFINGKEIKELEDKCAKYIGVKNAIGTSSGTDALLTSLIAYNIKEGDYIITTPFTFISTAEVISLLKAKPIFIDICQKTYNINPEKIQKFLDNPIDIITKKPIKRDKIKGIISVNMFGQPSDYDSIHKISKKHNLFIIEDAAQSFGAEYKGKKSGSLGDISITSFFPSKPVGGYGDGGMIFTNNKKLSNKIRQLINHGQTKKYEHIIIGMNNRLDTIQASILLIKLNNFIKNGLAQRNKVANTYTETLNNIQSNKIITLPFIENTNTTSWAQYTIQVKQRHKIIKYFKKKNIPFAIHYPKPLHLQKAFQSLGYKKGDFPIAEKISKHILSLPFDELKTKEEINYICKSLIYINKE